MDAQTFLVLYTMIWYFFGLLTGGGFSVFVGTVLVRASHPKAP